MYYFFAGRTLVANELRCTVILLVIIIIIVVIFRACS